jgi:outer membrane immunogenic protein
MYRAPAAGGYKDTPYVTADWAGFYAGVNAGSGWNDRVQFEQITATGSEFGLNAKGGFGGGQVGYNWQGVWHPHLVLGVEADIQGSDISDTINAGHIVFKNSLDWFGTVRGRLGYAFGPSLVYGTGGFAYGGIRNEFTPFKFNDTATGYTVGGGLEYKFSPAWSAKVEYQFINLGRNDPTFLGINICASTQNH